MPNYDPLVSIIVPAYNAENTLDKTIGSILSQNYRGQIEIIVIDDGSSDKTFEKARKYSNFGVLVFSQKNRGVSAARNAGIKKASGKYILFCDADDILDKNMVTEMIDTKRLNQNALIICDIVFGDSVKQMSKRGLFRIKDRRDIAKMILQNTDLYSPCNKLYDSEIAKQISFPEGVSYGEDLIFNLRYINYVDVLFFLNKPLYHYLYSQKGSSSKSASLQHNRDAMMNELKTYLSGGEMSSSCRFVLFLINCRWHVSVIKAKFKGGLNGVVF